MGVSNNETRDISNRCRQTVQSQRADLDLAARNDVAEVERIFQIIKQQQEY
jgi:hypothetical protein